MRRSAFLFIGLLTALGVAGACTQDFNQFDPAPGFGGSSSTTGSATSGGGRGGDGGDTTSSTSTMPVGEDCLNGLDDDSNGDIDCADAACGDHECVGVPGNSAWMGPGLLYDGDPGMVPACPPEFPEIAYEGIAELLDQDATCSACTCGASTITCTPANLAARSNAGCSGGSESVTQPVAANMCAPITVGASTDSYQAAPPAVSGSPCPASGGVPTVPPPQVQRAVRVCSVALSGAGCGASDEVCVPIDVSAPFEGKVCVWRDGDFSCPTGYPDRHEYSTTVSDTRDCSNCSCGDPNPSCTVTTTVYSDAACQTAIATVPNNNSCVDALQGQSIMIAKTTMGGNCAASGGQPTGGLGLGTDRQTVCCRN